MPWWFWVGWSVPLGAWLWRITFRSFVGMDHAGPLEAFDVVWSVGMATLCFLVMGPGLIIHDAFSAATRTTDWDRAATLLGGESRMQKRKRREVAMAEREARVREAERELGIGQ